MTLASEWNDAHDSTLMTKVAMALKHTANGVVIAGLVTSDADKRKMSFAKAVEQDVTGSIGQWVQGALVAGGLTAAASDVAIQSACDTNFAAFAWIFDKVTAGI